MAKSPDLDQYGDSYESVWPRGGRGEVLVEVGVVAKNLDLGEEEKVE